jgi:regulator of nucleoside diphosphate kinase
MTRARIKATPRRKRLLKFPPRPRTAEEFIMAESAIIVTDADMDRLTRIVRAFKHSLFRDQQQLDLLGQVLSEAEVRPLTRVPKDVIGMNSRVRVFDFETRSKGLYTLAFPEEADISRGLLSILAPLGIALLGRRKGDVIEARVPGGSRRLRVEGVRQQTIVSTAVRREGSQASLTGQIRRSHEPAVAV